MIRAACKAHYGTDEVDGIAMTVRSHDYNFRQAFKRMWGGVRAALANTAHRGQGGEGLMWSILAALSKPFTDLSDFVRETDERNEREKALERRRSEINRINAQSRWEDFQPPQTEDRGQEEKGNG